MLRIHNEENKKYVNEVIVPKDGQTLKDIEENLIDKIKTTLNV